MTQTSPPIHPCRCGPLLQLCRGPLLPHTGLIGALRVLTVGAAQGMRAEGMWASHNPPLPLLQGSAAFWQGPSGRLSLQRIAAIAFPSTQELQAWQQAQDAAALRDHRRIGKVSPA